MNNGLKNELSFLCGLGAAAFLSRKRYGAALGLAGIGSAIYFSDLKQPDSFKDQSVVITGGSRGLGLALALRLAKEGARLTLLARDENELREASKIVRSEFPNTSVLVVKCDVTNKEHVKKAFAEASQTQGGIDMLINVAGSITVGPYNALVREDYEAQMDLHLYAIIQSTELVLPYFKKSVGRRIVNICSMGGRVAVPHMLAYDTSKFALSGYSQGMMAELAPEGISVTTVYPSLMRTGSAIQAVFKGDHEKEFAWFSSFDNTPGISLSAAKAAEKIVEAARERRTELMPSFLAKFRMLAAAVFPETVASVMKLMAFSLPRGTSLEYKTGAQSRRIFDDVGVLAPQRIFARQAEVTYNQNPKEDAAFNLGLKESKEKEEQKTLH